MRFCFAFVPGVEAVGPDLLEFRLGTATPGGGFQLFGDHLSSVVNEAAGDVRIETVETRGSRHNLELLERGDIDIGLVEGNAAHEAFEDGGRSGDALRVLAVMYPNPGMFVVRADSAYHTIADLRGRPVVFGTRASGLRMLAHDVLSGLELSADEDFEPTILEKAEEGPRMVLEGAAEALWGAGIGWPGFVRVAESEVGARFIAPSAAEQEQILAVHPHLRRMTVPAGTYRGQDRSIRSGCGR